MEIPKSFWKHSWEAILIFLFGMLTVFFHCQECWTKVYDNRYIFILSGILWLVLWKGNELMSDVADKKISWMKHPVGRLALGLFLHITFSILAVMLFNLCVDLVFNRRISFDIREYLDYSLVAVIITLFIAMSFTARRFFISWRDLAVQHEKLKTVAIESRFMALKNQVNPHFLFNSLNVLTNLVYKDPDQSARFIQKLAQVYRYVLDTQEKEMVPILEELDCVRSFVYLQKIRFGQYLTVNIDIADETNIFVLPLSIQMLVENAIKHNTISKDCPLSVNIYLENEYIIVENELHPKSLVEGSKTGIGLENIRSRYKYLSNKEVLVNADDFNFIVQLPILQKS